MHQDNGSEFQGAFERACQTLGILQIYSRPHTPKDNPSLERFNSTIQYEWLKYSKTGLDDINAANQDLTNWLVKYNSYRPHQALDYKTPWSMLKTTSSECYRCGLPAQVLAKSLK